MQPFIIQRLVAPWVSPGPLPCRTVVRNVSSALVGLNDLVLFHVLRSVTVQRHVVPVRAGAEPAFPPVGEESGRRAGDRARVGRATVRARARRASFDGALRLRFGNEFTVCVEGRGGCCAPSPPCTARKGAFPVRIASWRLARVGSPVWRQPRCVSVPKSLRQSQWNGHCKDVENYPSKKPF